MDPQKKQAEDKIGELPLDTKIQSKPKPVLAPESILDSEEEDAMHGLEITIAGSAYSGPLPPPHLLAQFNAIIPNGADRIMKVFERQAYHRMLMETLGPPLAFLSLILILAAGCFVAYLGDTKIGGTIIVCTLVGIVGIFITGKSLKQIKKNKKHTEHKE